MVTSLLWRLAEGTLLILQSFSTLPLTLPPCYPAKDLSWGVCEWAWGGMCGYSYRGTEGMVSCVPFPHPGSSGEP